MTAFLAAAALCLARPAAGGIKDEPVKAAMAESSAKADTAGEVADPEMLKELNQASASNLENAMSRARDEAARAAAQLAALMASARAQARGFEAELSAVIPKESSAPAAGSLGEDLDDLRLAVAALAEKETAFRKAAEAAELAAPAAEVAKLLAQRALYRVKDRLRDLTLAESFAKAAAAKHPDAAPDKPAKAAAEAAAAFSGEAVALRRLAEGLETKLLSVRAKDAETAAAAARAKPRREALGADAEALKTEARLLQLELLLSAADNADFDAPPAKGAPEDE